MLRKAFLTAFGPIQTMNRASIGNATTGTRARQYQASRGSVKARRKRGVEAANRMEKKSIPEKSH